jgi:hypothetical protein
MVRVASAKQLDEKCQRRNEDARVTQRCVMQSRELSRSAEREREDEVETGGHTVCRDEVRQQEGLRVSFGFLLLLAFPTKARGGIYAANAKPKAQGTLLVQEAGTQGQRMGSLSGNRPHGVVRKKGKNEGR